MLRDEGGKMPVKRKEESARAPLRLRIGSRIEKAERHRAHPRALRVDDAVAAAAGAGVEAENEHYSICDITESSMSKLA